MSKKTAAAAENRDELLADVEAEYRKAEKKRAKGLKKKKEMEKKAAAKAELRAKEKEKKDKLKAKEKGAKDKAKLNDGEKKRDAGPTAPKEIKMAKRSAKGEWP